MLITSMAEFSKNSPFVENNNKNNKQANITKISNDYDLHLTVHFLWNISFETEKVKMSMLAMSNVTETLTGVWLNLMVKWLSCQQIAFFTMEVVEKFLLWCMINSDDS